MTSTQQHLRTNVALGYWVNEGKGKTTVVLSRTDVNAKFTACGTNLPRNIQPMVCKLVRALIQPPRLDF